MLRRSAEELCPGLESDFYATDADKGEKGLSNGMGLFLQKTNIIRDYLEVRAPSTSVAHASPLTSACEQDIMEEPAPRMFWPRVVWSKCVESVKCLCTGGHADTGRITRTGMPRSWQTSRCDGGDQSIAQRQVSQLHFFHNRSRATRRRLCAA